MNIISHESLQYQIIRQISEQSNYDQYETAYYDTRPRTTHLPDQCHHYIPRFILRNFAHEGSNGLRTYLIQEQQLVSLGIAKAYSIQNMYRELNSNDCMEFEKLLASIECSSSTFIRTILSDTQEISLSRVRLIDFKKFLGIMTYRNESRRQQYFSDNFDLSTRLSIQSHMRFNNIKSIHEVWFENLKWIIKTPVDGILQEFQKVQNQESLEHIMSYRGPIHVTELMDFSNLITYYVCIWRAEEGSEFIITDNCFGCFEGHGPFTFHNFFVISPKYAVVLVNRLYMGNLIEALPFRKSWFEELHANPECVYTKTNVRDHLDFSPSDIFKYRRIVIPKQKVWLVNSIFLDARHKSISYKSALAMYESLLYYDQVKDTLFEHKHDYTVLKRKLFSELSGTHFM